ncbi:hypothetical protein [Glaesserella parasuis]|nr:hypothetical protein [Glaesserella parasuis]MDD2170662.1 hypothetical protein [Glaesserella parasuis]MDG6858572.1 hypothetical protein [Glaesserella parasuis]MDO9655522.1 hypothetical protein [Glaesserella parasuis]MDO9658224.1 hypothetical protein [Glaesserella parasuis]MDO9666951.1 hypothetical protein [Glaesserella parasuis]
MSYSSFGVGVVGAVVPPPVWVPLFVPLESPPVVGVLGEVEPVLGTV